VPTVWRERARGASRFRLLKWLPAYWRWYCYALGLKKS
jgi:dolichol-phosphate mannosyltransferase